MEELNRLRSPSDARPSAEEVIAAFSLVPLPAEGGFFRETYRSPINFGQSRSLGTAIFYFVTPSSYSLLHQLRSDEMYHFYAGDPIELVEVTADDQVVATRLGSDWAHGERFQHLVQAGHWQGCRLVPRGEWALVGTTVWPGFEFSDFTLADPSSPLFERPPLIPFRPR